MKIAIIGTGLSGSSVLRTILTHPNFKQTDEIIVFEPLENLGPGFPYAPDDETIMINSPTKHLSVDLNNSNHFNDWLEKHFGDYENKEGLVSRQRYGQYLAEHFAESYAHPQVMHIRDVVTDMEVLSESDQYRLKTSQDWLEDKFDSVFFAVGHQPYNDYYDLIGTKNYIHNPYPASKYLSQFKSEQKIGIIGSGTTSIDMMRYFTEHYDLKHPLTYYEREHAFYFPRIPYDKEDFKFTLTKEWVEAELASRNGYIPFEHILETLRSDIASEGVNLEDVYNAYKKNDFEIKCRIVEENNQDMAMVQAYISRLGHVLPELYNALSEGDRDYYLKNYFSKLLFFRSMVPNKSFRRLAALYEAGDLRIVFVLSDITVQADGSFLISANEDETADVLVNATGFASKLDKAAEQDNLIKNLYEKELILPAKNGQFIQVDWPESRLMTKPYGLLDQVYWLGSYIRGAQHENNDAKLIIQHGIDTAQRMMNKRKCETCGYSKTLVKQV